MSHPRSTSKILADIARERRAAVLAQRDARRAIAPRGIHPRSPGAAFALAVYGPDAFRSEANR